MKNKNTIILIIVGAVLACLLLTTLGVGGYFVWSAFDQRNTDLSAAQARSQEMQANIATAHSQVESLKKNLDALQANYNSLDADYSTLTENYNTLTGDHNALIGEAEKAKQDVAAAKTKNVGLQSEVDKTRAELSDVLERMKKAYIYANMVYVIYAPWRGVGDFDFNDSEIAALRVDVQPWLDQLGDPDLQSKFDKMLDNGFEDKAESAFHLALLEALENSLR
jgi:hypothetical protein